MAQDMTQILEILEKNGEQQVKLMKKQLMLTRLTALILAVALGGILWAGSRLMPKVQTVLTNLNEISTQLAAADLYGTTQKIDLLVESGQTSITEASDKLTKLDVDTLNAAIAVLYEAANELKAITAPLSGFFGR